MPPRANAVSSLNRTAVRQAFGMTCPTLLLACLRRSAACMPPALCYLHASGMTPRAIQGPTEPSEHRGARNTNGPLRRATRVREDGEPGPFGPAAARVVNHTAEVVSEETLSARPNTAVTLIPLDIGPPPFSC